MIDPLNQAIQLIKSGQKDPARAILLRILEADPSNESAWLWLTQCLPNDAQRIAALERCLKFNPNSERAQKGLAQLRQRAAGQPQQHSAVQPPQPPPAASRPPISEQPRQTTPAWQEPQMPSSPMQWAQPLGSTTPQVPPAPPAEPRSGSLQSRLARQTASSTMPSAALPLSPTPRQPAEPPDVKPQAAFVDQPPVTAPEKSAKASQKPAKSRPAAAKRPKRRRWLAGCMLALLALLILGGGGAFLWYRFIFLPQPQAGLAVATTVAVQATSAPATPHSLPSLPATYTPAPSNTPAPTHTRLVIVTPGPSSTPLAPATALALILPESPVILYVAADACVVKAVSAAASEALTLTIKPPSADCLRPKFSPDGKKLAFVLDDDNYDLYVMNLDGTGLTMVADATAFAWSPDSRQLAYYTRHPETLLGGLAVVNADGSDAHLIGYEGISICTGCDGDIDLSWSPDGQWLYAPADLTFPNPGSITGNIFKVDGSEHRQLSEDDVPFATAAVWSPNGQHLALPAIDAVEQDCNGLNILDVEGDQTTLDATQAHLYGESNAAPTCLWGNFQWSPNNGKLLGYGHPRGDFNPADVKYDRVLVMTADGEDVNLLAHWAGHPGASIWSSDGKQIVFVSSSNMDSFGSPGPLVIMNYNPEAPEQITLAETAKNFPGALFWLESPALIEPTSESPQADTPTPTNQSPH